MERRLGRKVVVIVEDDKERGFQAAVKALEIAQGEGLKAEGVFGGEEGKIGPLSRVGLLCRKTHVIEEGCDIRVSLIDAVPDAVCFPFRKVARDESGLAGPGRSVHPGEGIPPRLFEGIEEPGANEDAGDPGAGDLGDGREILEAQPGRCRTEACFFWL